VHLLRGGALPRGAANLFRGGAPIPTQDYKWRVSWDVGEVAATLSTLVIGYPSKWCAPLLQVVRPPPWETLHPLLYIGALFPLQTSWSLGIAACSCTIVILFIWNKETLEVKKVCYTCVWMLDVNLCLIYEVIFA
jgi:hypothetical protein